MTPQKGQTVWTIEGGKDKHTVAEWTVSSWRPSPYNDGTGFLRPVGGGPAQRASDKLFETREAAEVEARKLNVAHVRYLAGEEARQAGNWHSAAETHRRQAGECDEAEKVCKARAGELELRAKEMEATK